MKKTDASLFNSFFSSLFSKMAFVEIVGLCCFICSIYSMRASVPLVVAQSVTLEEDSSIQPTNSQVNQSSIPDQGVSMPPSNAALSLSVHPPVAYVAVKPAEQLKHTLIVKNHGRYPLEISVNITDFKPDGKTGQPVLQPGKIFNRITNPDLEFGESFLLQPGRNRSINLQINVSEVATEKEYPLAIMVNARSISDFSSSQTPLVAQNPEASYSQVAGTVVSNLIVYIGNNESNQGKLELAKLNLPKLTDSFAGIHFDILAENTGHTAILIQGRAIIKNLFEQTIAEYIFYPDFILADSTRMVRGTNLDADLLDSEGLLDPEKIDTLFTQFQHKPPFMIGKYQVELQLGEERISKTVIALPFSLLILAGVGWLMYFSWKQVIKKVK